MGGGFCLYPNSLQFKQRFEQHLKIELLKDKDFDLLSRKEDLQITNENDVEFPPYDESHFPDLDFNPFELQGLEMLATQTVHELKKFQESLTPEILLPDLKKIFSYFVFCHPKDGLLDGTNLLSG